MTSSRALFVGGPLTGVTAPLDGEPPTEWRTVGLLAPRRLDGEETDFIVTTPIHLYRRYCQTPATKYWLYEYEGLER